MLLVGGVLSLGMVVGLDGSVAFFLLDLGSSYCLLLLKNRERVKYMIFSLGVRIDRFCQLL